MYKITTLPGGARVISHRLPAAKSVSTGFWIGTGGRYENKKNCGVSHFLEHVVFKGTKKRSAKKLKLEIEGVGGSLNGFTGEEVTCYLAKMLGKHLKLCVDVLSDMICDPLVAPADIEKERTVICEEIKMYLDMPMYHVREVLHHMLWPGQPIGMSLAGTIESVRNMTRKDILCYREAAYVPGNVIVAACGDVDHDELAAAAGRFLKLKAASKAPGFRKATVKSGGPLCKVIHKQTEQTHFSMGMHSYHRTHPLAYALALLNIIIGANMSSRLFQEVREKRGLVYDIHSSVKRYRDTGAMTIAAGVEHKKAARAARVVLDELGKVKKDGVRKDEFTRAKDFLSGQLLMGLEDTMEHMTWMGERLMCEQKVETSEEVLAKVEKVKQHDLRRVAQEIFRDGSLRMAIIGPLDDSMSKEIRDSLHIGG